MSILRQLARGRGSRGGITSLPQNAMFRGDPFVNASMSPVAMRRMARNNPGLTLPQIVEAFTNPRTPTGGRSGRAIQRTRQDTANQQNVMASLAGLDPTIVNTSAPMLQVDPSEGMGLPPRADIGDTMQRDRDMEPRSAPTTTDRMFDNRMPPAMSSARAIRPVTSATAPEPFSRAEQREGMEGFTSDPNQTNEKFFDMPPTRAPDAIGRMPRRLPEAERDPGTDAELDAGIDQAVDTEKDESFKFDPDMDLVRLGLEISAAASKPGATFLGSLAQGGLNHLNRKEKRELIQEDRAYKQSIMKMEQNFKRSERQLDRAQELGIAQDRIKVLENQNEIRAESLAETIRKNSEMLKIEFKKLKTEDQKAAEGKLMAARIKALDAQASNFEAQASGEKDKIRLSDAKTEREYVRAIIDLIDVDKLDVLGKSEAAKNTIYRAEVERALGMVGVIRTGLEKFLPGVTAGVKKELEGGGGGGGGGSTKEPNPFDAMTK